MSGCYVVFHKQLGDLLLLEPALSRLRDYHGSPVSVLTRSGHLPLLHLMAGIEAQRGIPLAWKDGLYCYDPLNKSALRSVVAPAARKVCILPEKREMQWFHRYLFREIIVPELGDRYVAEYFWDNTPVPAKQAFRPPRLNRPPEDWIPAGFKADDYILINPTSGWRQKMWTVEGWAETLNALHESTGVRFVMTSASTDWQVEHCRAIALQCGTFVQSLSSGTSLENFLWLCANARMVLTVDGAASHLAQAFGGKSLALFGPTNLPNWHFETPGNRAIWGPLTKKGQRRLAKLPAGEVLAAAQSLWGGTDLSKEISH